MKKLNKKGFTIVELVIVIAVMAVLAAVLIPTFSNVIGNAKEKRAVSDVQAIYSQQLVEEEGEGLITTIHEAGVTIIVEYNDGDKTYKVEITSGSAKIYEGTDPATYEIKDGKIALIQQQPV